LGKSLAKLKVTIRKCYGHLFLWFKNLSKL